MSDPSLRISHLTTSKRELEQVARLNGLAWGQALSAEEVQRRGKDLLPLVEDADPAERCLLIAVRSDEVVGFAQASHRAEKGSPWMFTRLAVHPDYRRTGIARKLCCACINYAKKRGAEVFLSETHLDNASSIAFHNAFGFRSGGEYTAPDGDRKVRFTLPLY